MRRTNVYANVANNLLLPQFTVCAQVTSPPLHAANWATFQPLDIAHVDIKFDSNSQLIKITNNSADNLLLTPEALVGTVITSPEFSYQYVLQKREIDQCISVAVSLLDFYSARDLVCKMDQQSTLLSTLLSLQKGQYLSFTTSDSLTDFDLVRIK